MGKAKTSQPREGCESDLVVPLAREELEITRREVETGRVRIKKTVTEHEQLVEEPLLYDEVEVQRVPVNRVLDAPAEVRYEGEVLVIPILEEILVKQLVLKEELRVSRRSRQWVNPQRVALRSEEAVVERTPGRPE